MSNLSSKAPGLSTIPWRDEEVSRLVLGTVQLGMDYGIANEQGRPDARKAAAIVEAAWQSGIRYFDTAQAYGASETVLGQAFAGLGIADEVHVASKLATALDPADLDGIAASIEQTFERLGVERLWCMMFHNPSWLDHWDRGVGELLLGHRAAGRIQNIGVSLSYPDEAARCLAHPHMDILQIACNAWDRRMVESGVLATARKNGQLCCVRSIYLKGLLVLPTETVAQRLPMACLASERWNALAARYGIEPVEMAVRFALTLDAPLVVGAESPEQIAETARLARLEPLAQEVIELLGQELNPVLNEVILTPRRWEDLDGAVYNPSGTRR